MTVSIIDEAVCAGASVETACAQIGISKRTLTRWRAHADVQDRRGDHGTSPAHKLTEEERARILEACHSPEYRNLSPRQIVPLLADRNIYIASESSFYRVLREAGELAHRGHTRPGKARPRKEHVATAPNRVWSWDITYMRSPIRGVFFFLYLVIDVYSRKIIKAEVHSEESQTIAANLIKEAMNHEQVDPKTLVLHADNGGPMKGSTMLATLQRLGVIPSFSRPAVSDDNAFIEALFRTLKYRPGYPRGPFKSLADAASWVRDFVQWYNCEHLHSGIRYVTPDDRHNGRDKAILGRRHRLYIAKRKQKPRRWTGSTRNWTPVGAVYLNPVKQEVRVPVLATPIS